MHPAPPRVQPTRVQRVLSSSVRAIHGGVVLFCRHVAELTDVGSAARLG